MTPIVPQPCASTRNALRITRSTPLQGEPTYNEPAGRPARRRLGISLGGVPTFSPMASRSPSGLQASRVRSTNQPVSIAPDGPGCENTKTGPWLDRRTFRSFVA